MTASHRTPEVLKTPADVLACLLPHCSMARQERLRLVFTACEQIHKSPIASADKDFSYENVCRVAGHARTVNVEVIRAKCGDRDRQLIDSWAAWNQKGYIPEKKGRTKFVGQTTDITFSWVHSLCPDPTGISSESPLEDWRSLAEKYMSFIDTGKGGASFPARLSSIRSFLEHYLYFHSFFSPEKLLTSPRGSKLPVLRCGKEVPQADYYNRFVLHVCDFIDWVIANDERFTDDEQEPPETLPGVRNPFERCQRRRVPRTAESVYAVLPYKYIVELRELLAPGENFRDWKWAHQLFRANYYNRRSGAWFEVDRTTIDESDPDCVWRERTKDVLNSELETPDPLRARHTKVGVRIITEMWSPVSFVVLLLKLFLPLRTYQARMLDSGEIDELLVSLSDDPDSPFHWIKNHDRERLLATLNYDDASRVAKAQGVFRKVSGDLDRGNDLVGFYINTNKTADADKEGSERGYVIPWQCEVILRWLIKLRNWQRRYNPITKPTLWTELTAKHFGNMKSTAEVIGALPTCFLFRDASARHKPGRDGDEVKPVTSSMVDFIWNNLLLELEKREEKAGAHGNGAPFRFIKKVHSKGRMTAFYPLHSLRVSLLTALMSEGGVTLQTLMKIAGHSRIVMTLYYCKESATVLNERLQKAQEMLTIRADAQMVNLLKEGAYTYIATRLVGDEGGLQAALPVSPNDRNAVGWFRTLGGWCLVGGNTEATDGTRTMGGCSNGGRCLNKHVEIYLRDYASVKPHRCIESGCRWFVTRPEYFLEIKARMDLLLFNHHSEQRRYDSALATAQKLRRERKSAEDKDTPFLGFSDLKKADSLLEKVSTDLEQILDGIRHTIRLMERCREVAKADLHISDAPPGGQIIAVGTRHDVDAALGEVRWSLEPNKTELLQCVGICLNAEIFPELENEAEKAVLRRSQILDSLLKSESGEPSLLSSLDPNDQLLFGNRMLRALAKHYHGEIEPVVDLLISGKPLPDAMRRSLESELQNHALNLVPAIEQ